MAAGGAAGAARRCGRRARPARACARGWFYGRLLLVPLVVLGVFHLLFAVANPRYDGPERPGAGTGWASGWRGCCPIFRCGHLLFFGLGFVVTAGALVAVPVYFFADHESRFGEFMRRQRDRVASFGVRRPDFRLDNRPGARFAQGIPGGRGRVWAGERAAAGGQCH